MFEFEGCRAQVKNILEEVGVIVPDTLPLLSCELKLRSINNIADRALALHLLISRAYGCPRGVVVEWLSREGCSSAVTSSELDYINNGGDDELFKTYVEGLWVLVCALGVCKGFDPFSLCSNELVAFCQT